MEDNCSLSAMALFSSSFILAVSSSCSLSYRADNIWKRFSVISSLVKCPFHFVLLDEKGLPLNSYYTIFPFPFPVLIYAVFHYFLNLFCYLFLGYPLEYRFHFFSAYIVPFHDYFCGCRLLVGLCPAMLFLLINLLLYNKIERIDLFYTL